MFPLKNYTEPSVKTEVSRRKSIVGNGKSSCWCGLCEADVTCLALTVLPPRYCMMQSYGMAAEKNLRGAAHSAVQNAMVKVALRPKHRPGFPDFRHHRIRIVNFALEEGSALVRSVMMAGAASCTCPQCIADTLAYALNRFPPLYGVDCDGSVNFRPAQREFFRHDLGKVLEQAAKIVSARPHH